MEKKIPGPIINLSKNEVDEKIIDACNGSFILYNHKRNYVQYR